MPSLEPYGEDPEETGLLAVRVVGQILDEAYAIAKAAHESGQPWRYLAMLKELRNGRLGEDTEEIEFLASQGDIEPVDEGAECIVNEVATSTPQKLADVSAKPKAENSFIGQGDAELETRQSELNVNSTSMFINHLFDMSEVERVIVCDDTEVTEVIETRNVSDDEMLTNAMTRILDSFVANTFNIAFGQDFEAVETNAEDKSRLAEQTCLSMLADAFSGDLGTDVAFYIDEDGSSAADDNNNLQVEIDNELPMISEIIEVPKENEEITDETIKPDEVETLILPEDEVIDHNDDVAFYENTYLTLNRDYEQCSDEEREAVIEDTKEMVLQEVELMTANSSEINVTLNRDETSIQAEKAELTAVSRVTGASSRKSKSSLMSRCRSQGARLLSCLRGWWSRKKPGKRRENRQPGAMLGICPLSPDARRRASSLLDQRAMYSPYPSRSPKPWKFNTVNETLVKSTHWNDYTFEVKPDECGEQ